MSSSKKNVKKSTQVSKPLPFNKANATAFGQAIYSEEGNSITFTRLCDGSLEDKNGNKTVHCAVGEAYFQFVNRNLKPVLDLSKQGANYVSKYDATSPADDPATLSAIDALVDAASLKSDSRASKKRLATALSLCVLSNDDDNDDGGRDGDLTAYLDRARDVQQTWKRRVLPLLK